jgi:hypothetical protein
MMVRRRYPIKKKKDGEKKKLEVFIQKKKEEEEEEYGIERLKSVQACCLIWMAWLERERWRERERDTSSRRKGTPATFAVALDVINEFLIFFLRPCSFVCLFLLTARFPHGVSE